MNNKQRKILIAVCVVIVGMLVYPPFQMRFPNGVVRSAGYSWLWEPPLIGSYGASVDIGLLAMQWVGVLIVGAIAFFLTKDQATPSH